MEVHRELGPGWADFAYRAALAKEFKLREVFYRAEVPMTLAFSHMKECCLALIAHLT
jgi:hypothetical protein